MATTIDTLSEAIPQEEKDFATRVMDFKDKFFVYFNSVTKNESVAKDLVQEVFLTVHKQYTLGFYIERGKLPNYLMRIAANVLKDYLRINKRQKEKFSNYKSDVYNNFGWSEPSQDYLTKMIEEKDIESKNDFIDKLLVNKFNCIFLNSDERRILQLRHSCDYSFMKISQFLNIPATTVAFKYKVAIKKLRIAIKNKDVK
ncbi:MAG: RNA polymerase sigma factor [Bacteroidales bacterium]|nr:RNA polymerase sigma factor [Bacteroidales bacterium]